MFSLCIPTANRFDGFLSKTLPKYLNNPYVNEIVITDETGDDVRKIQNTFCNEKLKLVVNRSRLGPFFNKLKAGLLAQNEWVALLDSDNFADTDYFVSAVDYIADNNPKPETILAPCFAKPRFLYTAFQNKTINRGNVKDLLHRHGWLIETFLNTGNFIVNKQLFNISISEPTSLIYQTPVDVLLFNLMVFDQHNADIVCLKGMEYQHAYHADSAYLKTHEQYHAQIEEINSWLRAL